MSDMEAHLMSMLKDLEQLNAENKELRGSVDRLTEKLAKAKHSFKLQLKDLQKQHKGELERLRGELRAQAKPEAVNCFQQPIVEPGLNEELTRLEAQCMRLETERDELAQRTAQLERRVESLSKENKKLHELTNEWERSGAQEHDQLLKLHAEHEAQVKELRDFFRRDREELVKKFNAELRRLKAQQTEPSAESRLADERKGLLERENASLISELRFFKQKLKLREEEGAELQARISEYHELIANLKGLILKLEKEIKGSSQIGPGTKLSMLDELKSSMTFLNNR